MLSGHYERVSSVMTGEHEAGRCGEADDTLPANYECVTQQWIHFRDIDRPRYVGQNDARASNANRFYDLTLRGGVDGIRQTASLGQGGWSLHSGYIGTDGTINRSGVALDLNAPGQPVLIENTTIKHNNVLLKGSNSVAFINSKIVSDGDSTRLNGRLCVRSPSLNTAIENSDVEAIDIDYYVVGTRTLDHRIDGVSTGLNNTCDDQDNDPTKHCTKLHTSSVSLPIQGCL